VDWVVDLCVGADGGGLEINDVVASVNFFISIRSCVSVDAITVSVVERSAVSSASSRATRPRSTSAADSCTCACRETSHRSDTRPEKRDCVTPPLGVNEGVRSGLDSRREIKRLLAFFRLVSSDRLYRHERSGFLKSARSDRPLCLSRCDVLAPSLECSAHCPVSAEGSL
jgi:hypothetical protein